MDDLNDSAGQEGPSDLEFVRQSEQKTPSDEEITDGGKASIGIREVEPSLPASAVHAPVQYEPPSSQDDHCSEFRSFRCSKQGIGGDSHLQASSEDSHPMSFAYARCESVEDEQENASFRTDARNTRYDLSSSSPFQEYPSFRADPRLDSSQHPSTPYFPPPPAQHADSEAGYSSQEQTQVSPKPTSQPLKYEESSPYGPSGYLPPPDIPAYGAQQTYYPGAAYWPPPPVGRYISRQNDYGYPQAQQQNAYPAYNPIDWAQVGTQPYPEPHAGSRTSNHDTVLPMGRSGMLSTSSIANPQINLPEQKLGTEGENADLKPAPYDQPLSTDVPMTANVDDRGGTSLSRHLHEPSANASINSESKPPPPASEPLAPEDTAADPPLELPEWFLMKNVILSEQLRKDSPGSASNDNTAGIEEAGKSAKSALGDSEEAASDLARFWQLHLTHQNELQEESDRHMFCLNEHRYFELHNILSVALKPGLDVRLGGEQSCVLLRTEDEPTSSLWDSILKHLATELAANLISLEYADLIALSETFEQQDATREKVPDTETLYQPRIDRYSRARYRRSSSVSYDSYYDSSRSASASPVRTTLDSAEDDLVRRYFGCQRPRYRSRPYYYSYHDSRTQSTDPATSYLQYVALLLHADAEKRSLLESDETRNTGSSTVQESTTLMHFRACRSPIAASQLKQVLRNLRGLTVRERRKQRKIVLLVSTRFTPEENTDSDDDSGDNFPRELEFMRDYLPPPRKTKEPKKQDDSVTMARFLRVDTTMCVTLHSQDYREPIEAKESEEARKSLGVYNQNVKRLKRLLHDELSASNLALDFDFESSSNARDLLQRSTWTDLELQQAARQIHGATLRKPGLEQRDIEKILDRIHPPSTSELDTPSVRQKKEKLRKSCNAFERALLDCLINPESIDVSMSDVILDPDTKRAVQQLVVLHERSRQAHVSSYSKRLTARLKLNGILLYGPPGTGKTLLARALAKTSQMAMLSIDSSTIRSKWMGESEKYIKATFTLAVKLHPCILFLDEVDDLFRNRVDDDTHYRSDITQFLQRMDGLNTSTRNPLVIVATNRPGDLDDAFLRRLPQKVMFSLPTEQQRVEILMSLMTLDDMASDVTFEMLAKLTEGYSGSDLKNLCDQAVVAWLLETSEREHDGGESNRPLLHLGHFKRAFRYAEKTVSDSAMAQTRAFARRFKPQRDQTLLKDPATYEKPTVSDQDQNEGGDKRGNDSFAGGPLTVKDIRILKAVTDDEEEEH